MGARLRCQARVLGTLTALFVFQCCHLIKKCPWEPHVFKAWFQLVARSEEVVESFRDRVWWGE